MLVAVVIAGAWAWSLYTPLTQAALRQQTRNLTAVAQAASLVAAESTASPAQIARRLVARTDLRLTIVAGDGTVLADSAEKPSAMANHASRPEIAAALEGKVGTSRRVSATRGDEELYVAVPANLDGQRVALRVSQPITEIEAVAARSRQMGLLLLAVTLTVTFGIAIWASAEAADPVAALSLAAQRMADGDLTLEIPEVSSSLSTLAGSLTTLRNQMRARIEALESEQRTLRTTLNGLTDAVFLLDGPVIRYANDSAGRLFRAPAGGYRDTELGATGLPASVVGAVRDHLGDELPFSAELQANPLGRTLRLLVVPLDDVNGEGRTLAVISDVTERARLDAVRRDFVANASHELKTPVAGIQLLAESAETAASDGDIETSLLFSRQIEAEAARLKRLVGDLLDLSRLDTAPEPGTVTDVRSVVDNAIVGHRGAAFRAGLRLDADFSAIEGVDVFAAADPTDLAVALDNLVDNALAYTLEGGVSVAVKASSSAIMIAVTDTGPGIAPEHLPRIFERFYRVDRARSRESGGTGLGLALVRHVAERSGGTVNVESTSGSGSTFTLRFPRAV
jgi:two-component system phosphate regulon sensor histidine kinase PhoR